MRVLRSISDRPPRGLTLIELMVAIVLMSAAICVTVVHVAGVTETARVRSAAGKLAAFLESASDRAALSSRSLELAYELDRRRVRLLDPTALPVPREAMLAPEDRQCGQLAVFHCDGDVRIERVRTGEALPVTKGTVRIPVLVGGLIAPHTVTLAVGVKRMNCSTSGLETAVGEAPAEVEAETP